MSRVHFVKLIPRLNVADYLAHRFFLPVWPLRWCTGRPCERLYPGPYFTAACRGTERLYCGDSNGHVGFESFSSHISLTLRTPVLFISERVTATGHGMKYILSSLLINNPGERRRRLQSVFIYQRRREDRKGAVGLAAGGLPAGRVGPVIWDWTAKKATRAVKTLKPKTSTRRRSGDRPSMTISQCMEIHPPPPPFL